MHARHCSSALVVALGLLAAGCGWTSVAGGKVAKGDAHDGKVVVVGGVTYAAFSDSANSGRLTVMKADGGAWVVVGTRGFSPASVGSTTFALAGDASTLYVAFTTANGVGVMKFAGTSWVSVGPPELAVTGSIGQLQLLVVGGKPTLALSADKVQVFALNGADWGEQSTGLPAAISRVVFGAASDGTLYLAYNDYSQSLLALSSYSGGTWAQVATFTAMIGDDWAPALQVSAGTVFLIYDSSENGPVVLKLNGSVLESVGALGSISAGDSVEYVSGAVSNGVPYVAFDDEARDSDPEPKAATVKQWTGSAWVLYAGYANACDIENTFLYAESPGSRLFLTYSDCDGDMTVQVH